MMHTSIQKFIAESKALHNERLKSLISELYEELNQLIYNGELPRLTIVVKKMKNAAASVRLTLSGNTYTPTQLNVSDLWDLDRNTWRGIIAHELVHVYLAHRNIRDIGGSHGIRFMAELDRINRQYPDIKAPRYHEGVSHPLSKHYSDNIKEMDYLVYVSGGSKWVSASKSGVLERDKTALLSLLKNSPNISMAWFGKSSDEILEKIPKVKSFVPRLRGYGIPNDKVEELIAGATETLNCVTGEYVVESIVSDLLRLPKNNHYDDVDLERLTDVRWQDIGFDDLGSDTNVAKLQVTFPFETKAPEDIIIDVQVIDVEDAGISLYQPHFEMARQLQSIGLGYKILKSLVFDLGHLYIGNGRTLNKNANKMWDKLNGEKDLIVLKNETASLCITKDHPQLDDYVKYMAR